MHLAGLADMISLDYWVLAMTFIVAGLMVSNITYHSVKEANLKERRPFGLLVAIVALLVVVAYHPALVLFLISLAYVLAGIGEALFKLLKRQKAAA
jgi:CDP-diacylglycerol--serine O-phosphatidyltransferase